MLLESVDAGKPLAATRRQDVAAAVDILPGFGASAGQALVDHPGIDKIAFTGSPQVGKRIMAAAAARCARVTLELGCNSPEKKRPATLRSGP